MTTSAFIPFCSFGNNMTLMGEKIEQFDIPVCNSFTPRILNDQLCYEIDLNKIKCHFSAEDLSEGLSFVVDENHDRQTKLETEAQNGENGE